MFEKFEYVIFSKYHSLTCNIYSLTGVSSLFMSQPAITCLKLTIETLDQGDVKYVQS